MWGRGRCTGGPRGCPVPAPVALRLLPLLRRPQLLRRPLCPGDLHCGVCGLEVGSVKTHVEGHAGAQSLLRWRCASCPFSTDLSSFAAHCAQSGHPASGGVAEVDPGSEARLLECVDQLMTGVPVATQTTLLIPSSSIPAEETPRDSDPPVPTEPTEPTEEIRHHLSIGLDEWKNIARRCKPDHKGRFLLVALGGWATEFCALLRPLYPHCVISAFHRRFRFHTPDAPEFHNGRKQNFATGGMCCRNCENVFRIVITERPTEEDLLVPFTVTIFGKQRPFCK